MALLLCECRILYQNKKICEFVLENEQMFKKSLSELRARTTHAKVKECVDDVTSMLFRD